jgi:hypothetical protein
MIRPPMSARTPDTATQKSSSGQKGQFRNSGAKKFPLIHHSQKVPQLMTTGASIFAGKSGYHFPIVSFDLALRSPYELGLACWLPLLSQDRPGRTLKCSKLSIPTRFIRRCLSNYSNGVSNSQKPGWVRDGTSAFQGNGREFPWPRRSRPRRMKGVWFTQSRGHPSLVPSRERQSFAYPKRR